MMVRSALHAQHPGAHADRLESCGGGALKLRLALKGQGNGTFSDCCVAASRLSYLQSKGLPAFGVIAKTGEEHVALATRRVPADVLISHAG